MRAYFFLNQYLSSIQNGIQAQHCTTELFVKYNFNSEELDYLWYWADVHKTTIVLNGGYSSTLRKLVDRFDRGENPYPWATFNESEEALDGALTCVGIVLPEKIYETALALREMRVPLLAGVTQIAAHGEWSPEEGVVWELSKWEYELCQELNKYGLAS